MMDAIDEKIILVEDEYSDAVRGRDNVTELSIVKRFNPKINQWSSVVAMNSRGSGVKFIYNIRGNC